MLEERNRHCGYGYTDFYPPLLPNVCFLLRSLHALYSLIPSDRREDIFIRKIFFHTHDIYFSISYSEENRKRLIYLTRKRAKFNFSLDFRASFRVHRTREQRFLLLRFFSPRDERYIAPKVKDDEGPGRVNTPRSTVSTSYCSPDVVHLPRSISRSLLFHTIRNIF